MCLINKKKGSVTLEAALCVPIMMTMFLLLYGLLEMFLLYNCISKAMYETADMAASYGVLYHRNGIDKLEKHLQDKLSQYVDLSLFFPYGDDLLYQKTAENIVVHYLEQDPVYQRFFRGRVRYDFSGSRFYNGNSEVVLKGHFLCDYTIPFMDSFLKGFALSKTVLFDSFTEGVTPDFSTETSETESIWSLSNFERGKLLQEQYGRNLPQFFPIIDYYQHGTAGIIRSINHTLKTYQDDRMLEQVLDQLSKELLGFQGASYGGIIVEGERITKREILLIFPEDDFTSGQQAVVDRFVGICRGIGIDVTIERYEYTRKQ